MRTQSEIAAIRFGLGLSPLVSAPTTPDDILARLSGFDADAARFPIPMFAAVQPSLQDSREAGRRRNRAQQAGDMTAADAAQADADRIEDAFREVGWQNFRATLARGVAGEDGFRERLTRFWADHFTVLSRNKPTHHLVTPYVEEAVRPHIAGRFVDLLWAVTTHPMMLMYLNQVDSFGPESELGQRMGKGLNENLARELLELHTLGVGASYTQDDVRQMAELLTGLTYTPAKGFFYDPRMAEPGAETVLGIGYMPVADLSVVRAAIEDIAAHPDTARHIARKLAVHFVADQPDEDLVAAMTDAFTASGGDLFTVYGAMLAHPAAWVPEALKVKQPLEFVTSAMRALGVTADRIAAMPLRDLRQKVDKHLTIMGQEWERPLGPDGWPETAVEWVTPQGMAGRINWAMTVPAFLLDRNLPDPRDFVTAALGEGAPEPVRFAASAAETQAEGIGVILSSAAFQRR